MNAEKCGLTQACRTRVRTSHNLKIALLHCRSLHAMNSIVENLLYEKNEPQNTFTTCVKIDKKNGQLSRVERDVISS